MNLPSCYVISREVPMDGAEPLERCLRMTPVCCAIVSSVADIPLALRFHGDILRSPSDAEAVLLAMSIAVNTQHPSVVIGNAGLMDAVYEDGHREEVACQC